LFYVTRTPKGRDSKLSRLDLRRVEHDADSGAHSLGGEVAAEVSADSAGGAVGALDAAPDDSVLRALLLGRGAEDVGNALTHVPLGGLLGLDTVDLEDSLQDQETRVAINIANYHLSNSMKTYDTEILCKAKITCQCFKNRKTNLVFVLHGQGALEALEDSLNPEADSLGLGLVVGALLALFLLLDLLGGGGGHLLM